MIERLLRYEKYLKVMDRVEQERLLYFQPTLSQLQRWDELLQSRKAQMDSIFGRAYKRQNKYGNRKQHK